MSVLFERYKRYFGAMPLAVLAVGVIGMAVAQAETVTINLDQAQVLQLPGVDRLVLGQGGQVVVRLAAALGVAPGTPGRVARDGIARSRPAVPAQEASSRLERWGVWCGAASTPSAFHSSTT